MLDEDINLELTRWLATPYDDERSVASVIRRLLGTPAAAALERMRGMKSGGALYKIGSVPRGGDGVDKVVTDVLDHEAFSAIQQLIESFAVLLGLERVSQRPGLSEREEERINSMAREAGRVFNRYAPLVPVVTKFFAKLSREQLSRLELFDVLDDQLLDLEVRVAALGARR